MSLPLPLFAELSEGAQIASAIVGPVAGLIGTILTGWVAVKLAEIAARQKVADQAAVEAGNERAATKKTVDAAYHLLNSGKRKELVKFAVLLRAFATEKPENAEYARLATVAEQEVVEHDAEQAKADNRALLVAVKTAEKTAQVAAGVGVTVAPPVAVVKITENAPPTTIVPKDVTGGT